MRCPLVGELRGGHAEGAEVCYLEATADGAVLFSCGSDGGICVWDTWWPSGNQRVSSTRREVDLDRRSSVTDMSTMFVNCRAFNQVRQVDSVYSF